jgi:YfiH family protein
MLADIPIARGYRAGISLSAAGSLIFRVDNYLQSRAGFLAQFGVRGVLFGSRQVNSRQVVVVDDRPPRSIGAVLADAMVTYRSDAVLTLIVADCLPIYLVDTASGAFGLVHSGWKGTGIVMEAIRTMASLYGTLAADIEVTIGPGIGVCCYRVPIERGQLFQEQFGPDTVIWDDPHSPRIDLRKANVRLLERAGVSKIVVCTDCTCCNPLLGSFRRDGANRTRMLTFLCRNHQARLR